MYNSICIRELKELQFNLDICSSMNCLFCFILDKMFTYFHLTCMHSEQCRREISRIFLMGIAGRTKPLKTHCIHVLEYNNVLNVFSKYLVCVCVFLWIFWCEWCQQRCSYLRLNGDGGVIKGRGSWQVVGKTISRLLILPSNYRAKKKWKCACKSFGGFLYSVYFLSEHMCVWMYVCVSILWRNVRPRTFIADSMNERMNECMNVW